MKVTSEIDETMHEGKPGFRFYRMPQPLLPLVSAALNTSFGRMNVYFYDDLVLSKSFAVKLCGFDTTPRCGSVGIVAIHRIFIITMYNSW